MTLKSKNRRGCRAERGDSGNSKPAQKNDSNSNSNNMKRAKCKLWPKNKPTNKQHDKAIGQSQRATRVYGN